MQQERKTEVHGIITMEEYLSRRQKIRANEKEKWGNVQTEEISPALMMAGLYM